jgi:hypothetical protein
VDAHSCGAPQKQVRGVGRQLAGPVHTPHLRNPMQKILDLTVGTRINSRIGKSGHAQESAHTPRMQNVSHSTISNAKSFDLTVPRSKSFTFDGLDPKSLAFNDPKCKIICISTLLIRIPWILLGSPSSGHAGPLPLVPIRQGRSFGGRLRVGSSRRTLRETVASYATSGSLNRYFLREHVSGCKEGCTLIVGFAASGWRTECNYSFTQRGFTEPSHGGPAREIDYLDFRAIVCLSYL